MLFPYVFFCFSITNSINGISYIYAKKMFSFIHVKQKRPWPNYSFNFYTLFCSHLHRPFLAGAKKRSIWLKYFLSFFMFFFFKFDKTRAWYWSFTRILLDICRKMYRPWILLFQTGNWSFEPVIKRPEKNPCFKWLLYRISG